MKAFTAACIQIAIAPNAVTENLEKIETWLERAVKENEADLVLFPETITTGFSPGMGAEELWDLIEPIPGRITDPIARAARSLEVHVVLPTYERGPERGVVYNSAALINPQGEVVGVYRKTHLFPTERLSGPSTGSGRGGWSTPGTEAPVFETDLGTIGMIICYDGDFPELSRVLAIKGAEVIVRPAALLRSFEIWEMTNRARAYDNHVYMVACNAIGPDAGGNYYFGHSQIVSPIAQVLAQARGTEEIIAAELDPDPIKYITYGAKSPMIFDHLQDRNLAAYEGILQPARSRFEPARRVEYLEG
ncbi:MAG: carbon-nitrogen hydrolase family protein [Anaerolineales bacterium]|nr:MAG: carbon-nitrogen hydrolase family protein [Anaerolineales bacterium]